MREASPAKPAGWDPPAYAYACAGSSSSSESIRSG
jgi:hypothetical protein